jgi:hypothetical protein
MKYLTLFLLTAGLTVSAPNDVKPIVVAWDAPAAGELVEGYRIYSVVGTTYTLVKDVPGLVFLTQLPDTVGGQTTLVATAYNYAGESSPSNTLIIRGRPSNPKNFRTNK